MDLRTQVEGIVEKILPAVEAWAARLEAGPPATAPTRLDPRELERHCRDLGLAVGHELFARLVQAYGDGRQGSRVGCACGGTRRWVGTRARRMRDLMNREVTLARAYYFCDACGQGWLPLDEALGLTAAQVTPALYEVAVTCGSVAPPEEATEMLAVVGGITLSPKSVERYTKAAGAATERAVTERAAATDAETTRAPEAAARPTARPYNVQLDGGMLRMRDGTFREVKVACLFDSHDRAEVHPGRRVLLRKHYEAYLGGPDPLGAHAYAAARAYGVAVDGSNAVSQGDGAPWVWNLVQLHWPAALEILDFYHLSEHLHACGQTLWGADSVAARRWAWELGQQVLVGDARVVRTALGRLRPTTAAGTKAVGALRRYVQTHAHRMDYGAWRQQGYAIASAAVESAHHGVVQRRLKRPGQRWTVRGAQRILAARRLWCNRDSPADVTSVAEVRHLVGPGYRRRAATAA